MTMRKPESVDEYISSFPVEIQKILTRIRKIILKYAPDAEEGITYNMPSYKTHGKILIYFAGYRNHIGLYATPSAHFEFKNELERFKHGKGSVQFPVDKPLPYNLITQIIKFRIAENKCKYNIKAGSNKKAASLSQ